jgi:hypothetical protein
MTLRYDRTATRHSNLLPGPVRWRESEYSGTAWAFVVCGGTALQVLPGSDDTETEVAPYVLIVLQDGRTTTTGFYNVFFPVNGPADEPPRWHPDVATLGPVVPQAGG